MSPKRPLFLRTVLSLLALGAAQNTAAAEEIVYNDPGVPLIDFPAPKNPKFWERCYGVVRKELNDCESTDGKHLCAGGARVDADPKEWIYVPEGMCRKLSAGKVGIKKEVRPYPASTPCPETGPVTGEKRGK